MKLYEKTINGKLQRLPASKIIVEKNGMLTINPSEALILEDGWELHEQSDDDSTQFDYLEIEKDSLKQEIERYDSSDEVNVFYMQGKKMWLDKATRAGLMLRFQAEQSIGMTDTTLWYDGEMYSLPLTSALQMLMILEVYASKCYDNTQRHLARVSEIESLEQINEYNYKEGYPEKLNF